MNITLSYDEDFDSLIADLRKEYGEGLFELEGIGLKQLDLNRNAKDFLESTTTTADVSVDANANVDTRDVIGYQFELPKPLFRLNSLYLLWKELRKTQSLEYANGVVRSQILGDIYINDFSDIGRPYCFNYSTYDIVLEGLPMITKINSVAPKYLYSFKSQVEQFIVVASNSTLGATGLADLLICMGLYVDKMLHTKRDGHIQLSAGNGVCDPDLHVWAYVKETLVSLIYTLNQPMRGNQSPFTNVSLYDDAFLDELCPSYMLDGKPVNKETVKKIQEIYMEVMNEELRRTPITFPVTTACFAVENGEIQDAEFRRSVSEANVEWGFINIYCGSSSTLSSCCRLRSETESEYFNSFGAGSTKIGSLGVVTLNLPRLAWINQGDFVQFKDDLLSLAAVCNRINNAKREIIRKRIEAGNMPLYSHGHMDLSKQYSTIGVTGLYEAMEILGYSVTEDEDIALDILNILNKAANAGQQTFKAPHNLEQVPAESSSVKLADKDYYIGYNHTSGSLADNWAGVQMYPYYSNQFIPLTANADMLERLQLQGLYDRHFSGGAICHVNVEERISDPKRIEELIDYCAYRGVVYWAINYNIQRCTNGHMGVSRMDTCACGADIQDNFTRVVGFLTNTKNWNKVRRKEDYPNRQFYKQS